MHTYSWKKLSILRNSRKFSHTTFRYDVCYVYTKTHNAYTFSSDTDAVRGPLAEQALTPSPTPLTNEGVEPVGGADLAQLYQLVVSQQRELASLRLEQQRAFGSLWHQLEKMHSSLVERQEQVLLEHTRDQRILTTHTHTPSTHGTLAHSHTLSRDLKQSLTYIKYL